MTDQTDGRVATWFGLLGEAGENGPVIATESGRRRRWVALVALLLSLSGCVVRPPAVGSAGRAARPTRSAAPDSLDFPSLTESRCPPAAWQGPALVVGDHGSPVSSIAFNLDGGLLASAGARDGAIRIWDVATCVQHGPALGHGTAAVARVVFSEDGSLIAGVGVDRPEIRVWDPADGRLRTTLNVPNAAGGLAFGNLAQLAIGTRDHIVFRDAETGAEAAPPLDQPGKIQALAYNANRSYLVSGSDNGTVVVWDFTHEPVKPLVTLAVPPGGSVVNVAICSRNVAATGLDSRSVSLWRLPDGTPVGGPVVLDGRAYGVACSPDEKHLAVAGADGIRLVDTDTGTPAVGPWQAGGQPVTSVVYDRTGRLASSGDDGKVRIWQRATDEPLGRSQV